MKALETWIYGLLLLVTLGFAWSSWKGEDVETTDKAVVLDPGSGGISKMLWDDERSVATIEVSGSGDDLSTWITAGKRAKIVAKKGDDDDSAKPAEVKPPEPTYGEPSLRSFPGNKQAKKLIEDFSPLRALREFAAVSAEGLSEMGLDEPKGILTVTVDGKDQVFEVGDKAYGSNDTYVRRRDDAQVYLVASKVIGPLRGAESRLMERDVFGFAENEVVSLVIGGPLNAPSESTELLQQGRHDKANAFWARPDKLDERDTALDGFAEKLFRLKASNYPKIGEEPAGVEEMLTVSFVGEHGPLAQLSLGREVDEKRSKDGDPAYQWFAKTEVTRGWVSVNKKTAADLSDALPGLLGR